MSIAFVVSAPSGAGKSTLIKRLRSKVGGLRFSVSYATRPPRGQEQDGVDYHFVSREGFEKMLAGNEFLEWAQVHANYYGSHQRYWEEAQQAGADLVLDIDVQGARQLKDRIPEAVSIFVLPPSREVLEWRLHSRGEDTEETIQKRLRNAAAEIRECGRYDYLLVNEDLEQAAAALCGIVRAERSKRNRMKDRIQPILDSFGI